MKKTIVSLSLLFTVGCAGPLCGGQFGGVCRSEIDQLNKRIDESQLDQDNDTEVTPEPTETPTPTPIDCEDSRKVRIHLHDNQEREVIGMGCVVRNDDRDERD